jgi:hypothetical protein
MAPDMTFRQPVSHEVALEVSHPDGPIDLVSGEEIAPARGNAAIQSEHKGEQDEEPEEIHGAGHWQSHTTPTSAISFVLE